MPIPQIRETNNNILHLHNKKTQTIKNIYILFSNNNNNLMEFQTSVYLLETEARRCWFKKNILKHQGFRHPKPLIGQMLTTPASHWLMIGDVDAVKAASTINVFTWFMTPWSRHVARHHTPRHWECQEKKNARLTPSMNLSSMTAPDYGKMCPNFWLGEIQFNQSQAWTWSHLRASHCHWSNERPGICYLLIFP